MIINKRAVVNYTLAIEANPDYFAYMVRANAYFQMADYDNAIADLTKMINLKPNKSSGYTLRGTAYSLKGDKARAEAVKWTPCRGQNAVKISKIFEIDR